MDQHSHKTPNLLWEEKGPFSLDLVYKSSPFEPSKPKTDAGRWDIEHERDDEGYVLDPQSDIVEVELDTEEKQKINYQKNVDIYNRKKEFLNNLYKDSNTLSNSPESVNKVVTNKVAKNEPYNIF